MPCSENTFGRGDNLTRAKPRPGVQGYEHAKKATLAFLEDFKEAADPGDRELLHCVARTSLRTKLYEGLADQLTDIVVDAVLTIRKPEEAIDLFMVLFSSHSANTLLLPAC